jgi:signal transduction histidine kinase
MKRRKNMIAVAPNTELRQIAGFRFPEPSEAPAPATVHGAEPEHFPGQEDLESRMQPTPAGEWVGRVTCGLTHDLSNMIHVVYGFSDLLEKDNSMSPAQREKLGHIRAAAESAGALIAQLRFVAYPQPPSRELLDMREVLQSSLALAKGILGPAVHLRARFSHGFSGVLGDRHRLIHAFLNCFLNARDAMPKGGTVTVVSFRVSEVSAARVTGIGRKALVICIKDTGMGMSKEVRRRLFEPYFSTKGSQGTGLGMSNVLETLRAHGGNIEVESSPGAGTTLRLYFPLAEATSD